MPSMPCVLIYIHGFNSSSKSVKATVLKNALSDSHPEMTVYHPTLSVAPEKAIAELEVLISGEPQANIFLIGSSLGGYYALYLAEKFGLKSVLINPACYPYRLLTDYVGLNTNLYTGEQYQISEADIQSLQRYEVKEVSVPENHLLLLQAGDEVLDYRQALAKLPKCPNQVTTGGSHSYEHFEQVIPAILRFFGVPAA